VCRYLGSLPGRLLPFSATLRVDRSSLTAYYDGVPVWFSPRPSAVERIDVSPEAREIVGYARVGEFYWCGGRRYRVVVRSGAAEAAAMDYYVEGVESATPTVYPGSVEGVRVAVRVLERPWAWEDVRFSCSGGRGVLAASRGRTIVYAFFGSCEGGWRVVGRLGAGHGLHRW